MNSEDEARVREIVEQALAEYEQKVVREVRDGLRAANVQLAFNPDGSVAALRRVSKGSV